MKSLFKSLSFIFAFTSIFYLALQIECLLHYYWLPWSGWGSAINNLFVLSMGQGQNILFGLILSGLYGLLYKSRLGRILVFGLLSLLLLYLIVNHTFYSFFFDHVQFGLVHGEANPALLMDSIWSQLSFSFVIHLIIALCLIIALARQLLPLQSNESLLKRWNYIRNFRIFYIILLLIYIALSLYYTSKNNNYNLSSYPALVTMKSVWSSPALNLDQLKFTESIDLHSLRHGNLNLNKEDEKQILDYHDDIYDSKPNVIFIVLESVGTKNIFPKAPYNQLDSILTPNLYKWKNSGILFPNLYNVFPGTTRSHITIATGGHSASWGSPGQLLDYTFEGATLANEFKSQGYKTSLLSSLILLNTGKLYQQMPFDFRYIPSLIDKNDLKENLLNSWGMEEEFILDRAKEWIQNNNADKPFFMQFLTSCTHHPYSTPNNYPKIFNDNDDLSRYNNALHYTDHVIGKLINYLSEATILNNTVIVITGDHGQAFGKIHRTNRLHRSKLYDENIRNFMMIIDFNENRSLNISQKIGGLGDIMPTLSSYIGGNPEVPGQNLFSTSYEPHIQYMHNLVDPYKWGLVDGQWKFITDINDPHTYELYNLLVDPDEQEDLALKYPDRAELYRTLCSNWYLKANQSFTSKLKNYGHQELRHVDLHSPGPKVLKFGIKNGESPFKELNKIHPNESLVAYTTGIAFPQNVLTDFFWTSPSGKSFTSTMEYDSQWSSIWVTCPVSRPLESGQWILEIRESSSGNPLIKGNYIVDEDAPLMKPFRLPPFETISFGIYNKDEQLKKLKSFNPNEKIVGILEGKLSETTTDLIIEWARPGAQKENNIGIQRSSFTYQKGWDYGWFNSPSIQPMQTGRWRVSVFDAQSNDILLTGWFSVSEDTLLNQ